MTTNVSDAGNGDNRQDGELGDDFYNPGEQVADYHYKLGRFVTYFADIEALIRAGCAKMAGTSIELTGVIFGELTAFSGGLMLTRLCAAKGLAKDDLLARALVQFNAIGEARNAILHRGVDMRDLRFVTKPGLPGSRRQRYRVDVSAIEAMSLDMMSIHAALIVAIHGDAPDAAIWAEGMRSLARTPWQYKHEPVHETTV